MSEFNSPPLAAPWLALGGAGIVASLLVMSLVVGACLPPSPPGAGNAASGDDVALPSSTTAASHASGPLVHPDWPETFEFGRDATEAEIVALDIDVRPDGSGLPDGRGSVIEGEELYAAYCARCHGDAGVGGPYTALAEPPQDGSDEVRPSRTIGSFWPYATTLFDYTRRTMPFETPGSLRSDQTYALTAYMLYLNDLVPRDATLDADSLPRVRMPARDIFRPDDRESTNVVR